MTQPPIILYRDGDVFRPATAYQARIAAREYGAGELVRLAPLEERSEASHRHYFAAIREAWRNLPERFASEPWAQSADHLRKHALIRTGWCSCVETACGTNAAALRVASLARALDEYAVAIVDGSVVRVFRAKSQSNRAMPKGDFQKSKDDVLGHIAGLIGVDPATLAAQGEAA